MSTFEIVNPPPTSTTIVQIKHGEVLWTLLAELPQGRWAATFPWVPHSEDVA